MVAGLLNADLVSTTYLKNNFLATGNVDITLAAGATWTKTIEDTSENGNFDFNFIDLKVFVLDEVAGSATNGFWIPADAVVSTGWKSQGQLIVINQHSTELKLRITATARRFNDGWPGPLV